MLRAIVIPGLLTALFVAGASAQPSTAPASRPALAVAETPLGPYHANGQVRPWITRDGLHIAYGLQKENGKTVVFLDGKEGPELDELMKFHPLWSFDESRLAYAGRRGDKWHVIDGDTLSPAYDALPDRPLIFSPDGKHLAYAATLAGKQKLILDGKDACQFDSIRYITFSSDGAHYSCIAADQGKELLVVDGQPAGERFDKIEQQLISPDGKHTACIAQDEPPWHHLLVDGKRVGPKFVSGYRNEDPGDRFWRPYAWMRNGGVRGGLSWSPDSRRVACIARMSDPQNNHRALVMVYFLVNGSLYKAEHNGHHFFHWGGDGRRFAYVVSDTGPAGGSYQAVVADGDRYPPQYRSVGEASFSPDGHRLDYWMLGNLNIFGNTSGHRVDGFEESFGQGMVARATYSPNSAHIAYMVSRGGTAVIVLDGRPLISFDKIDFDKFAFSPDSRRFAYTARYIKAGAPAPLAQAIVDDQISPEFDDVGQPVFSADSRHVGFLAQEKGQGLAVIDGKTAGRHAKVGLDTLRFSPDGSSYAYVAGEQAKESVGAVGRENEFVVVDGREGPRYDLIVRKGPSFRPDGKLEYLAVKEGKLIRVVQDRK